MEFAGSGLLIKRLVGELRGCNLARILRPSVSEMGIPGFDSLNLLTASFTAAECFSPALFA